MSIRVISKVKNSMKNNQIPLSLLRHEKAAAARETRRATAKRKAELEAFRRRFDPVFIQLVEALKKKGEFLFSIDEKEVRYENGWKISGFASLLRAELKRLGLQVRLDAKSDTVEYRQYTSARLMVTL